MISALMTQHHPVAGPLPSRKLALTACHALACWTPNFLTSLPIFCPLLPVIFGVLACPSLHAHTRVDLCWQSIFLTALAMSLLPAVWPIVL